MASTSPEGDPLAAEIQQEKAATYLAACRKMVDALEALKAFDAANDRAARSDKLLARRLELLERAAERVYFVVVQREAMHLSGYEEFFAQYEIPGEVRKRLGPRRPQSPPSLEGTGRHS